MKQNGNKVFFTVFGEYDKKTRELTGTMATLHERWKGMGYYSINAIAKDQTERQGRFVPVTSAMWYNLFNTNMTHMLIGYQVWTNLIRNAMMFALTHGIGVALYDDSTMFTTSFKPVCNLGKKKHVNELPASSKKHSDMIVVGRKVKYTDKYGTISERIEPVCYRKELTTDSVYTLLNEIFNSLKDNIKNNREANKHLWVKQEQINLDPFFDVTDTLNYSKVNENIRSIADDYRTIVKDSKGRDVTLEPVVGCDPTQSRESLIEFGREWSSMYAIDYPLSEDEAIRNAAQIMYYLNAGIEPCRDKPDVEEDTISVDWNSFGVQKIGAL